MKQTNSEWILLGLLFQTIPFLVGKYAPGGKPNVVIFIVDDLGIGDIGCYGNDTIRTPNIDAIARQGVKFEHNLAPESVCTPSRAAALTGRYAVRFGMANRSPIEPRVVVSTASAGGLPTNETTYARAFKDQGYNTGYFGKWHVGVHGDKKDYRFHPLNHGFDHYYGMPLTNLNEFGPPNDFPAEMSRHIVYTPFLHVGATLLKPILIISLVNMVLVYFSNFSSATKKFLYFILICTLVWAGGNITFVKLVNNVNAVVMRGKEVVEQPVDLQTITKRLTLEASRYITAQKSEPFLAVLAYHKVHIALAVDEEFRGKSQHGLYGDCVEEVDWSIGEVIKVLKEKQLLNDTFIYFTSDHGPANYAIINGQMHGGWAGDFRGGKGNSWEGGIRVPTLAMWPNIIPEGVVYKKPTSGLDLFPTLLNIIGVPLPTDRLLDGVDFLPKVSPTYIGETERFFFHYCGSALAAVTYEEMNTSDIWKLHYQTSPCPLCCFGRIVRKLDQPLLYNLFHDKSEKFPLNSKSNNDVYMKVVSRIEDAVLNHKSTLYNVENQLTVMKQKPRVSLFTSCGYPWSTCKEKFVY